MVIADFPEKCSDGVPLNRSASEKSVMRFEESKRLFVPLYKNLSDLILRILLQVLLTE